MAMACLRPAKWDFGEAGADKARRAGNGWQKCRNSQIPTFKLPENIPIAALDIEALKLLWCLELEDWSFAAAVRFMSKNAVFATGYAASQPGYFSIGQRNVIVRHYRNRTS